MLSIFFPDHADLSQVLLNIGFAPVGGEVGTLRPTGELARMDENVFVYNPVSNVVFARLCGPPMRVHSECVSTRRDCHQRHPPSVRLRNSTPSEALLTTL